jgi:hypothetical protein
VVLIAKDEAQNLPRLLDSLREFQARGGEVVLLDTGSTDGTPEVARSLGCRVTEVGARFVTTVSEDMVGAVNRAFVVEGEEPLVAAGGSFFRYGEARNYAATLASNNMVSMPDCDERYTVLDLEALEGYIGQGYEQLEFMFVYAHDPYGNEAIKFRQCKFYDRRKMKWKGIIHEVLEGTAYRAMLPENVLKLEHWQDQTKNRGHYLKGLALACHQEPDNDRNLHYLGREMVWTNRPKSALKVLSKHIAMGGWQAERAQSMIFMGDCCGLLNRPDEQADWYHRAFHQDPTRREALLRLAGFYKHNDKPKACAAYAAAALEIPWHPFYANNVGHYRQEPWEMLYWARGWMGDNVEGAQDAILKALEYLPHHGPYLRDTQYYFEYADQGIEGWMRFEELQWLYNTAKSMDRVAELGSWKGRSTHALASGCKLGHVTAIDHFKGSVGEEVVHREAQTDAVYEQFLENTKDFTNLTVVRKDTTSAAEDYPDGWFDLVFIDAEHTYEGVKRDIERWTPKARIMLAGHDYCSEWPGVQQAVNETLGGVQVAGTIWYKLLYEPHVTIIIPTLGRPDKLHRCLQTIKENAEYRNYTVKVQVDSPPPGNKGAPTVFQKALDEMVFGLEWTEGQYDVPELVMYLGNDCVPEKGFLREAVYSMARHFPDGDGLIGLNDGYWNGEVATHWLAGRDLYNKLGCELFHTSYHHVGCDNELTERARKLGKYHWEVRAKIQHDHPVHSGQPVGAADEVYALGQQHKDEDLALLKKRSEELSFPFRVTFRRPIIPRRIFSIWLSEDPMPEQIAQWVESQNLSGYEHHLITLHNCYRNEYVQKALDKQQWVRAADYLRLHYLYAQGGVYLDADVELLQPFLEDMLADQLFCGQEENKYLGNSIIGAVEGHPVLYACMQRMEKEYPDSDKVFEAGMQIWTEEVYKATKADRTIRIYPPEYFFPYNHETGQTTLLESAVAFHHYAKSWVPEDTAEVVMAEG